MSVRIMADVWAASQSKGNDRLVLLAIADHANDEDRTAWPSVEHLQRKCRLSRRTVFRALHSLSALGELRVLRGPGDVNHYVVLDPCQSDTRVNLAPVPDTTSGGAKLAREGCQIDTLTIREPSLRKPSVARQPRKSPLPEPFELSDAMQAFAEKAGVDPKYQFGKFKDYHRAKRTLHVDWVSAWRYWVRNALERQEARQR